MYFLGESAVYSVSKLSIVQLCVDGQMSSSPDGQLLKDTPSGQFDCIFYIELIS